MRGPTRRDWEPEVPNCGATQEKVGIECLVTEHIVKSHNKTLLLYHLVCPTKYRKKIFSPAVEEIAKEVCVGISERYEIHFVEIGSDEDRVHFLIQAVPMLMPTQIVKTIKSITARENGVNPYHYTLIGAI